MSYLFRRGTTYLARDGVLVFHGCVPVDEKGAAEAVAAGKDIVPKTTNLRDFAPPRTIGDGDEGHAIRAEIEALEKLIFAYRENLLLEA